jgi:hypothetical protein
METTENTWRLNQFEINFKKGYSYDNSVDRYEGYVRFENDEYESFKVKLNNEDSLKILDIVSGRMLSGAEELISRLKDAAKKDTI